MNDGQPYGAGSGLVMWQHDTIWLSDKNRPQKALEYLLSEYSIRIEKEVIHELLLRSQVADLCTSTTHAATPTNLQLTIPTQYLTNNSRAASRFWLKLARERAVIWEDVKFRIRRDFAAAKLPPNNSVDIRPLFTRWFAHPSNGEVMEHYIAFYDHTGWDGKPKAAVPLPPLPPWPHLTKTEPETESSDDEGNSD